MANKVSKVNIGITGDASGLAKATDQAAAKLRGLRAEAEKTRKRMGEFKGTANQTAESLAKFGVGGRGLQGIAAVAGIASLGKEGAALGAVGAMLAALTTSLSQVTNAVQEIPDRRKAAIEALKQSKRIGARPLSEFKLTPALAEGMARQRVPTAGDQLGMFEAFRQAIAAQDTAKVRTIQRLAVTGPAMAGTFLGTTTGGGGFAAARRNALEVGFGTSNMMFLAPTLLQIYDDADRATAGVLRMLSR